ncbi:MAG TPA: ABC transporter substrate-binding protein [Candidatus Polarisedimenticolia bacterium]|nr:ABC transporter substrate-binding protein [Candidatus Polarisedimenticolia bacterium]
MRVSRRAIVAGVLLPAAILGGCRRAEALRELPTLRLRLAQDPATLDPAAAVDQHSLAVVSQIHAGLVEIDPEGQAVRPALAERWEVSPDGLRYVFHLRPDAVFHDGSPVTAGDVVRSFERLLSPSTRSPRRQVLEPLAGSEAFSRGQSPRLEGARAAGRHTVELSLRRPAPAFLSQLALEAASIVAADAGGMARRPVGAGPFALESWAPGERITLRRAPGARAAGPGAVHRIVYTIIASEATALEEYLAGGLDVADQIPAGRRADLTARLGGEYRRWSQPALAYLGFNHAAAPFAGNRALRAAFNHAVDKEYIARVVNEGKDLPARGILPPGTPGFDPSLAGFPHDPAAARRMLAEAGFPQGRGLPEITLHYNTSASQQRIMERVRMDLEAIGVRVRLQSLDPAALLAELDSGRPVFFRMSWLAEQPDGDAFLTPTLHSRSRPQEGNFARYANPAVDELLDRAREETDPELRAAMHRRAQRLAVEDACWLLLYHHGDEALVKPRVRGLSIPALGEFLAPLERVRIDEGGRG